MSTNPYQSPVAAIPPPRKTAVWGMAVSLLPAVYPLLLPSVIYGTWVIGCLALGRTPRPYLDDPSEIGPATSIAYGISGFVLLSLPLGLIGSLGIYVWQVIKWNWSQRLLYTVLILSVWVAVFTLLQSDPWRVVDWFFD